MERNESYAYLSYITMIIAPILLAIFSGFFSYGIGAIILFIVSTSPWDYLMLKSIKETYTGEILERGGWVTKT